MVLNARPRWTVGSAIGKFTTQNPAVYHPQADKSSISLPRAGSFARPIILRGKSFNHSPFRTSQGVLKGCRARPCARAAERARACRRAPGSAISAWPPAVAGSSRWRRGCRPGWPAALVRSARSHADSHLAAESATAGQSVRRIQPPTGHSARWRQTATEVLSTAPRGPGTLHAQRHARGRPHHGPF